jgi:hypothetical protein
MERRFALEPLHDVLGQAVFADALAALPDQGVRRLGPMADATIGAIFPDEG